MNTPSFRDKIAEIFVKVDDFCLVFEKEFAKHQLATGADIIKRNRKQGFVIPKSSPC